MPKVVGEVGVTRIVVKLSFDNVDEHRWHMLCQEFEHSGFVIDDSDYNHLDRTCSISLSIGKVDEMVGLDYGIQYTLDKFNKARRPRRKAMVQELT